MTTAAKKLDVFSTTSDYSKTPDVEFCGYTIPHPSEPKMHVRLQSRQGAPADEALRSGLTDLRNVSKHIEDAYRKELQAFKRKSRKK
uniref:DNA-directed RNA polymerase RBP11-like dimerisation domain-containing protein n=1 Tax=Hyaloperonospora arabidopsidis (strain Emoy2) TaxID=559515 RepID=M4B300_HYAAE